MGRSRRKFILHAKVTQANSAEKAFDDTRTRHQIERRLTRLEQISMAYYGQISLRFDNGMLISFDSADAALVSACEMQNCCAALPRPSGEKLALRIGLHQCVLKQRSADSVDNTREFVAHLARIDDTILISQAMLDGLNQSLKKLVHPLEEKANEPEYMIDWSRENSPSAYDGELLRPIATQRAAQNGPYLQLHFGLKTLEVSENSPIVTIGRDPSNDLVIDDFHVSRNHCRVARISSGIVLVDQSANGTIVIPDGGSDLLVKKNSMPLTESGFLFFGRPFKGERRESVKYELF